MSSEDPDKLWSKVQKKLETGEEEEGEEGGADDERSLGDVLGLDSVADINDGGLGIDLQDDTFHDADVVVTRSEVGHQCDHGHGRVLESWPLSYVPSDSACCQSR